MSVCLIVQGCRNRDHIVNMRDENSDEAQIGVLNDLLLHRDAVCLSVIPPLGG